MADFCYDCTEELFGQKHAVKNDMSGIVSAEEYQKHGITAKVLCEGCGIIEVDHKGRRIENA
jgi:hypothetical protein|tara:strand:+ start:2634 stop:2819 length:186 start_codon:yes stop_codon:yes gene_type:complete